MIVQLLNGDDLEGIHNYTPIVRTNNMFVAHQPIQFEMDLAWN